MYYHRHNLNTFSSYRIPAQKTLESSHLVHFDNFLAATELQETILFSRCSQKWIWCSWPEPLAFYTQSNFWRLGFILQQCGGLVAVVKIITVMMKTGAIINVCEFNYKNGLLLPSCPTSLAHVRVMCTTRPALIIRDHRKGKQVINERNLKAIMWVRFDTRNYVHLDLLYTNM